MNPIRYERTSELIKAFKHSCSRVREEFHSLEMELEDFTCVLDEMTKNTYILVVVHDPTIGPCFLRSKCSKIMETEHDIPIETAAVRLNIRMARKKFEELQGSSVAANS